MMKSKSVVILGMIILGFVQILSIEAITTCPAQCYTLCSVSKLPFDKCYNQCIERCPPSDYNCIAKCGVKKTDTVTIGTFF